MNAHEGNLDDQESNDTEKTFQVDLEIILRRSPQAKKGGPSRTRNRKKNPSVVAPEHEDTVEAVMDKILQYDSEADLFNVQWYGYSEEEATHEPPGHLPYNKMVQHF